jgi:hypothetical protein
MTVRIASVTFDCSGALVLGTFWSAAFGRELDPQGSSEYASIGFAGRRDTAEVTRLVELGATRVADREEYGYTWTVMADPEGNEFCVAKQL